MICKPCSVAGDTVAELREMHEITIEKDTVDWVREQHNSCKGKTHCDCQHKIDFEGKTIQHGR